MDFPKQGYGRTVTRGLFFETAANPELVRFTLKDEDHAGYPSLRRLYLQADDPTEYEFAIRVIGSLAQWDDLCRCKWFKPFIEAWRRELELRFKAKALSLIREEALSGSKNAFAANRYLMEKGWEPKEGQRGRPTKADIQREAQRQVSDDVRVSEDYDRLLNPGALN
jgi:hypothetical protein